MSTPATHTCWHAAGGSPAELFLGTPHRVLDSGSTKPVVFQLEGNDGPCGFWVVKFREQQRDRRLGLLREQIGADLVALLGVPTPEIGWLRLPMTPLDADATEAGALARAVYEKDAGELAFCSRWVEGATTVGGADLVDLRSVSDAAELDALRVFAFDVWTRHYDRGRRNPNLLACGERLVAIDHGMILADLFAVDADHIPDPRPRVTPDLARFADHVCAPVVSKRATSPLWDAIIEAVRGTSDEQLDELADGWCSELDRSTSNAPAGMISLARSFLRTRRDHFPALLKQARAAVAR